MSYNTDGFELNFPSHEKRYRSILLCTVEISANKQSCTYARLQFVWIKPYILC